MHVLALVLLVAGAFAAALAAFGMGQVAFLSAGWAGVALIGAGLAAGHAHHHPHV